MSLPKAVEEMEKVGMEKWNELYGKKDEKTEEKKEPAPEPKEEPKPDPKPEPKEEPKEEDVKHKFDVLKGKYDAEVPRLSFELAEVNKKNRELEEKLAQLQKPKGEEKPPGPSPENKESEEKLKAFQQEYPEIYEGSSFLMKQILSEEFAKLKTDFSKLKENVDAVNENVGVNRKRDFLDALDKDPEVGKEWREINKDETFISWLQERAPYIGVKKHDVLMENWKRMDIDGTLEFFKDFKKYKTTAAPPKPKKEEKVKVKDEDLHPPKGGGSDINTKVEDEGEIITPDKLTEFANSVAKGEWKGRDKERDEEEKRLIAGVMRWKQKSLKR